MTEQTSLRPLQVHSLPLLIGLKVPKQEIAWDILMLLKYIVELAVATNHNIQRHRQVLQEAFPDFRLRPKHHFFEHYPSLFKSFGPLSDVWTMRFEGKHKFFKRVIRNAQSYKNVALTLTKKHQKMISYYLDSSSFFRPYIEMDRIPTVSVSSFPPNIQQFLSKKVAQLTSLLIASSVSIDGVRYCPGMVVSAGSWSGLPDFKLIEQILAINCEIFSICKPMISLFHEHLRSFELCNNSQMSLCVVQLQELNDVFPLPL